MRKHDPENELAKRDYLTWLRHAKGRDPSTLDQVAAAIHAFEEFSAYRPFKTFRREQAVSYKNHLADQINPKTEKPLSKATLHSRLNALQTFFEWLSREPGYRKAVHFADAAYFGLSTKESRIATATREKRWPTLEQNAHVLETMPTVTVAQRRDRAVVAFTILSGMRASAVASLRLKHVDIHRGRIAQDAREVKTKNSKTFYTAFVPLDGPSLQIVSEWLTELKTNLLFGQGDPLFPATRRTFTSEGVSTTDLTREIWTSAAPIREIFRKAFIGAGLEYFHPHSFRRTLMQLTYDLNLAPREMKAWSQNFGHDMVATTVASYGALSVDEQIKIIRSLPSQTNVNDGELQDLAAKLTALSRRRA